VSIKYIEGESLVLMLDDDNIAVSTRSACAAGALQASHVLLSIGRDFADAQGTLVITFGLDNSGEDVTRFLKALKDATPEEIPLTPRYQA
jgi:cysteine desulfurase